MESLHSAHPHAEHSRVGRAHGAEEKRLNYSWGTVVSNSICSGTGDGTQVKGSGAKAKEQLRFRKKGPRNRRKIKANRWFDSVTIYRFRYASPRGTCQDKAGDAEKLAASNPRIERQLLAGQFLLHQKSPCTTQHFVIHLRKRPLRAWWGTFEVSAPQLYCHSNTSRS